MQLVGGASQTVAPGQNLVFDAAVNDQSPDIGYNALTGEFTISRAGNYLVNWWVATNGTSADTNLWFSIMVGGAGYALGAAPLVTGQVGGSALVSVGHTPTVLTLANTTPNTLRLAQTPVQADIVILQVS